jgi:hypothetical protein
MEERNDRTADPLVRRCHGEGVRGCQRRFGIDPATGAGDWPDGLQVHAAGLNEDGHLVVTEIWATPEHQARFMEGRLGAALVVGGVEGPPSSVTWIELVAHHRPGG